MLSYLLAEGRFRLSRTIGSVIGIALGVALFTGLVSAADSFANAARRPLEDVGADIVVSRPEVAGEASSQTTRGIRQPFGLAPISGEELDELRQLVAVDDLSGGLLLWDFSGSSYQTLLGVALEADQAQDVGPSALAGSVSKGRFFTKGDTGVVVVDQHYAAFFGLQPGQVVEIGEHEFEVIGIVSVEGAKQTAGANFYVPLSDAQSLAGLEPDEVNQVYLRVGEATDVEAVVSEVEAAIGSVSATTEQSIVSVVGGITKISDRFAKVAAVAGLLAGLLLSAVTLTAGVNLRTREVGVMKATGWRARDVVRLLTAEGLVLSFVGALLGVILGWLAVLALAQIPIDLPSVAGSVPDLAESAPSEPFSIGAALSWSAAMVAMTAAILVGGLVSLVSARRISRLKPASALRS